MKSDHEDVERKVWQIDMEKEEKGLTQRILKKRQ